MTAFLVFLVVVLVAVAGLAVGAILGGLFAVGQLRPERTAARVIADMQAVHDAAALHVAASAATPPPALPTQGVCPPGAIPLRREPNR